MQVKIRKWFFTVVFLTLLFAPSYSYEPYSDRESTSPEWQPREMNSRIGRKIEAELKPGFWLCGFFTHCDFDLYYFFGSRYNGPEPNRKTTPTDKPLILFIPGGPGEIVHREDPYLGLMTDLDEANVVYFDVRGTGFSAIPESNDYDQFLRAKYVVEDIETLRKTLMNECSKWDFQGAPTCKTGVTPWHAIFATSWGTIVAQQYAAKYPQMVNKLILAAPVSRGHRDTEQARRKMIVDNLFDIFAKHRTKDCSWDRNDPMVKELQSAFSDLKGVENFCFLTDKHKSTIKKAFAKLLNGIETEYGSVNLIHSFYSEFKSDSDFYKKYPYPREFFDAIRELEDFGAGEQHTLSIDPASRSRKVGTAMYLAYYLWLPKEALTNESHSLFPGNGESFPACKPEAELFSALRVRGPAGQDQATNGNFLKDTFCIRIRKAWNDLTFRRPSFNHSARARNVFSVHDGLARWVFGIMQKERRTDDQGCFAGKDIQDIARGDSQLQTVVINSNVIKEQARKLGIQESDRLCPWDPAQLDESGKCRYCHKVDTLILKGGADAIIAGEQPEYLFDKALTKGHRALIEFSGVGHAMNYQMKIEDQKSDRFDNMISDFETAVIGKKFEDDVPYKALLEELKRRRAAEKQFEKQQTISGGVPVLLKDLIMSFVNSKTIHDFTQNETATEAIGTLGGCLRTEDNEEFSNGTFSECICKVKTGKERIVNDEELSKCICELTKGKHQICHTLTKKS